MKRHFDHIKALAKVNPKVISSIQELGRVGSPAAPPCSMRHMVAVWDSVVRRCSQTLYVRPLPEMTPPWNPNSDSCPCMQDPNNVIVIFSGSDTSKLDEVFAPLPVWMAAENGMYVRPPSMRGQTGRSTVSVEHRL